MKNIYTVDTQDGTFIITGENMRESRFDNSCAVDIHGGTLYLNNVISVTADIVAENSDEYEEALEQTEMLLDRAAYKAAHNHITDNGEW